MKKNIVLALILFSVTTLNAQKLVYDLGYGRVFNTKGNDEMTSFLDNYHEAFKSQIDKEGSRMKFHTGFEIQQMLTWGVFTIDWGYTRMRAKSKVLFASGDERSFTLRNGSARMAVGFTLGNTYRFYLNPFFAFNYGRTKLISEFERTSGSPNTGTQLNGDYKGQLLYSEFGVAMKYNHEKFGLYARLGQALPISFSDLETESGKELTIDYDNYVNNPNFNNTTAEKVTSRFGGLQIAIGATMHLMAEDVD